MLYAKRSHNCRIQWVLIILRCVLAVICPLGKLEKQGNSRKFYTLGIHAPNCFWDLCAWGVEILQNRPLAQLLAEHVECGITTSVPLVDVRPLVIKGILTEGVPAIKTFGKQDKGFPLLLSFFSYEFKVTPRNELGPGPSSDPVSFSTESGKLTVRVSTIEVKIEKTLNLLICLIVEEPRVFLIISYQFFRWWAHACLMISTLSLAPADKNPKSCVRSPDVPWGFFFFFFFYY